MYKTYFIVDAQKFEKFPKSVIGAYEKNWVVSILPYRI